MLISGSDAYFLEVSAQALLKIATTGSFRSGKSENLAFRGYFPITTKVNCFFHTYPLDVSALVSEHKISWWLRMRS